MASQRDDRSGLKKLAVLLPVAVLIHLLLLLLGGLAAKWLKWGEPDRDLTYRQFQITLERKMEQPDDEEEQKQVVTIAPPEKEEKPKEADFVSEFDSKVKKQTQAKEKRLAAEVTQKPSPRPQRPSVARPAPRPTPEDQKTPQDIEKRLRARPSPLRMRSETTPRERGVEVEPSEQSPESKSGRESEEQEAEKNKKPLKVADLRLSDKALSKAIGAPFPDYIENVPEGEKTLLNTKRWRFASFFNRVKRAVAQQWHPGRVYRRHDPTGNIYGFRKRLTVLKVTLDKKGAIKNIVLKKPCGLGFLDDEAVRAFKAAGPFPNPPSRLVDPKTGLITFSFGFLFEITKGPDFRIFRYR